MPEEFRTPDVFDGIMFNDEFLALELRLNELWDQVKHFIIVEAGETFTGIPKPLNFTRNQAAFKRYAEKITVVTLSGFPLGMRDPWEREAYQRNAILRGIPKDYRGNDLLIVSDCDEIPSAGAVHLARQMPAATHQRKLTFACRQHLYFYAPHWRHVKPWWGSRIVPMTMIEDGGTPQDLRSTTGPRPGEYVIERGGWSYSYMGGPEAIQSKVASYSHTEVNRPEFTNTEHIIESISRGLPLVRGDGNEFVYDTDFSEHPKFVQQYPHLFMRGVEGIPVVVEPERIQHLSEYEAEKVRKFDAQWVSGIS
jgi:beta-1,4-mannosyl-glycoprotein beta-1,4-N-acetylglucosaminyltransferase